jgi:3-hydroxyacyl-CoA dehydrogenase/enoyl-CoA hydratase/3-hydroxybutyryl-CoA epimerase
MSVQFYQEGDLGFVEFNDPDSKVNILNSSVLKRLEAILDEISQKSNLSAIIFQSAKKDIFIAGADIKEIESITKSKDGAAKAKAGQEIMNRVEDLKIPTIALIDGIALGGGCEFALACQYRLSTFNPRVQIGLPEVNLGFIPGFGGTYRLPRIVGLEEGLKMILTGKPLNAEKALKIGLVDRLVPATLIKKEMFNFINDIKSQKIKPNKFKRYAKKGLAGLKDSTRLLQSIIFDASRQSVLKQSKGFYPAPLKAIDVIRRSFYEYRSLALRREADGFANLAITPTSKNLVHVFYISEKYRKCRIPGTENISARRVQRVGVVGAGIMGGGIVQLLSSKEIWARLKDINHEAVAKGFQAAGKIYHDAVKKRRMLPGEAQNKMNKITGTLDYSGFAQTDLIIEAVVENMDVKRKVFRDLSEVSGAQTILATNTSALSVETMANETKDPTRVIGIHFFNPVHRMPLVEIIVTPKTSKETLVTTLEFVKTLGKTPIVVKDACGFIVNRILLGYINEAGRILEECADIKGIDKIMTDFGMPMGPFALTDEVGTDVGIKVLHILEDAFGERFRPVKFFDQMITKGFLGKKNNKGFYLHEQEIKINPEVQKLLDGRPAVSNANKTEYLERMLYMMINEAARCLEEKIVDEAAAIDVGMIFGTGFPAFRGGLLKYADSVGLGNVIAGLQRFEKKYNSDRFKPCEYLIKLSSTTKKFYF